MYQRISQQPVSQQSASGTTSDRNAQRRPPTRAVQGGTAMARSTSLDIPMLPRAPLSPPPSGSARSGSFSVVGGRPRGLEEIMSFFSSRSPSSVSSPMASTPVTSTPLTPTPPGSSFDANRVLENALRLVGRNDLSKSQVAHVLAELNVVITQCATPKKLTVQQKLQIVSALLQLKAANEQTIGRNQILQAQMVMEGLMDKHLSAFSADDIDLVERLDRRTFFLKPEQRQELQPFKRRLALFDKLLSRDGSDLAVEMADAAADATPLDMQDKLLTASVLMQHVGRLRPEPGYLDMIELTVGLMNVDTSAIQSGSTKRQAFLKETFLTNLDAAFDLAAERAEDTRFDQEHRNQASDLAGKIKRAKTDMMPPPAYDNINSDGARG